MSASSATRKTISHFLTSPSKIAHALDWRKAVGANVMTMTICKDIIKLAVAPHPNSDDEPQSLPSIPMKTQVAGKKRVLSPEVAYELSKLMNDWKVCGLIVSWPVQEEGWCGASCGRVLFALDQLADMSNDVKVLSQKRKICLWNDSHNIFHEDEFGRDPVYAKTSNKSIYYASKEQYEAPATLAVDVWNDFCHAHWPEIYQHREENEYAAEANSSSVASSSNWLHATAIQPAGKQAKLASL